MVEQPEVDVCDRPAQDDAHAACQPWLISDILPDSSDSCPYLRAGLFAWRRLCNTPPRACSHSAGVGRVLILSSLFMLLTEVSAPRACVCACVAAGVRSCQGSAESARAGIPEASSGPHKTRTDSSIREASP